MKKYERKLLNKRDGVIVAGILLAAALWALVPGMKNGSGDGGAVIVCENREVGRLSLREEGDYTFPETGSMIFTVRDGEIFVSHSECGDMTCVRTGGISSPGEAIVCVPNRVVVTVEGSSSGDVDVVLK